jgi:hypothetical protein
VHAAPYAKGTPVLHLRFPPSFCWTQELYAFELRARSIARGLGIGIDVLKVSRLDICMDTMTPTHETIAGLRTGKHARGRAKEARLYHEHGIEAPPTGSHYQSRNRCVSLYAKSIYEEGKKESKREFYRQVWGAFGIPLSNIFRVEMRAFSTALRARGIVEPSSLTVRAIEANWRYMSGEYYRYVDSSGVVTPAWRAVQEARWAGDASFLRDALSLPPYLEDDDDDELLNELKDSQPAIF